MKKQIAAVALVLTLAVAGIASARGGMGGGMGGGMNCPQMQGQMAMQQLDKATQDKLDAFQRDTQALRKQIVMKHAEMRALMQAGTPNPTAVSKLSGELFDLQGAIQDKARAAGIENLVGGPCGMGCGMMGGRGGGRGMMMGGKM